MATRKQKAADAEITAVLLVKDVGGIIRLAKHYETMVEAEKEAAQQVDQLLREARGGNATQRKLARDEMSVYIRLHSDIGESIKAGSDLLSHLVVASLREAGALE